MQVSGGTDLVPDASVRSVGAGSFTNGTTSTDDGARTRAWGRRGLFRANIYGNRTDTLSNEIGGERDLSIGEAKNAALPASTSLEQVQSQTAGTSIDAPHASAPGNEMPKRHAEIWSRFFQNALAGGVISEEGRSGRSKSRDREAREQLAREQIEAE